MSDEELVSETIQGLPALLTVEHVQKVLHCTRRHVYRLVGDGRLRGLKTAEPEGGRGGRARLLIPRGSLEKLLRRMLEAA